MITKPIGGLVTTSSGGIPTDNLAEYLFSGNALDTSGNGFNGTVANATLTSDRNSSPNSAYNFTSSPQAKITTNLDLSGLTKLCISTWFRRTGTFVILGQADSVPLRAVLFMQSTLVTFALGNSIFGRFSHSLANWNNIIVIFDGSGIANTDRLKLYLNGVSQSLTYSGTIPASTPSMTVKYEFGKTNSGGVFSDGDIDDTRISNRIWTQDEIDALANE